MTPEAFKTVALQEGKTVERPIDPRPGLGAGIPEAHQTQALRQGNEDRTRDSAKAGDSERELRSLQTPAPRQDRKTGRRIFEKSEGEWTPEGFRREPVDRDDI